VVGEFFAQRIIIHEIGQNRQIGDAGFEFFDPVLDLFQPRMERDMVLI